MKKLLSLILATALVIGLAPMSFALEANTAVQGSNEWVFNSASHGKSGEARFVAGDKTNGYYSVITLDGEETGTDTTISDPWAFLNQTGSSSYMVDDHYLIWTPSTVNSTSPVFNVSDASFATMNSLVLEVKTDTAGTFSPAVTYVSDVNSAIYEVYFFEKKHNNWGISPIGSAALASLDVRKSIGEHIKSNPGCRLGVFDAYGDGSIKTTYFPKTTVKADTSYYLVLVANGNNERWTANEEKKPELFLKSFSLSEILPAEKLASKINSNTGKLTYDITTAAVDKSSFVAAGGSWPSYINGTFSHIDWTENTLDLTKTDPYAIEQNTASGQRSSRISSSGMYCTITVNSYKEKNIYTEMTIRLNVPYAGRYKVTLVNKNAADPKGSMTKVHFGKALPGGTYTRDKVEALIPGYHFLGWHDSRVNTTSEVLEHGIVDIPAAGEYYVVFSACKEGYEKNPTDNNTGAQTIDSKPWQWFYLSGIELTPVENEGLDATEENYDSIVNVDADNATEETPANTISNVNILCGADRSTLDTYEVAAGSVITYTAPQKDGYTFLYWAQGIGEHKKVVSYDADLSVKAEKGPMWITAVYADNSSTRTEVVFYNANGDEISRSQYNENDTIALPALPSMAGFETATGWILDTDGETYTLTDEVKASGKLMRFVAEYDDEPSESFAVTVNNGTVDNAAPVYGETVTVTAEPRNGAKLFNYWEKDGEIVSFNSTYSFKAWKNTTVTAVYKDYLPVAQTVRKIIMGTRTVGTETAAVAEFIGVSDIVEKGILFGTSIDDATHKVSMKTDGDTFSVIDDVVGDAIGYAILENGNVIYSK